MKTFLKIKAHWKLIVTVAIFAFALGLLVNPSSTQHKHAEQQTSEASTWTCSMHPQIRQPDPGKCPICAMDLIPVVEDKDAVDLGEHQLKLSVTAMKLANIETSAVTREDISKTIPLYGKIAVDETRLKSITAWAPGRIEKLYVDYTGAAVKFGEPLVDIYSPELFVAQQEYLNALDNSSLLNMESIRKKFELWGISEKQLEELESRGTAREIMTIYAPLSGIVLSKVVSEGQYVKTGSLLYDIADLGHVWILFDAYEKDLLWLKEGQRLSFSTEAIPGTTFSGRIDFIDPVLNAQTRTVKVRAKAENSKNILKPGLLVTASINAQPAVKSPLVIPISAALITGERAVVYVAVPEYEGVFEGREIVLGERSGNYFIVKSGLSEGEYVVTHGAFKIDSEMQILAKKSMMSPDGGSASMLHQHSDSETGVESQDSHIEEMHETNLVEHTQHEAAVIPKADDHSAHQMSRVPRGFIEKLDPIYLAYFEIQEQLAHDKNDKLNKSANALMTALGRIDPTDAGAHAGHWGRLSKELHDAAQQIAASSNIGISRSEFKKLSDAMIQIVDSFSASGTFVVRQYHCPMAFNNTGADWLSPKDDVENPYFGDEMFSCGRRVKTFVDPEGGDE